MFNNNASHKLTKSIRPVRGKVWPCNCQIERVKVEGTVWENNWKLNKHRLAIATLLDEEDLSPLLYSLIMKEL